MDRFKINLPTGKCEIHFKQNLFLPQIPSAGGIYIADSNTVELLKDCENFDKNVPLVVIPAGETNKNLENIEKILQKAFEFKLARDSVFIGFGGGVITDMAAFASSIYMRGTKLALVPTSLLAMVDAAIGGKTGIDYANSKNSIGSFYPAENIYISIKALDSLDQKEFLSGLAEVFKTAILFAPKLYNILKEEKEKILEKDPSLLLEIVKRCIYSKSQVVEKDLFEKNERMFLNLGHTFAHALESLSGFDKVSHGDAVAWGIARALELGKKINITDFDYAEEVKQSLNNYGWQTNPIHSFFEPQNLSKEKTKKIAQDLLNAMKSDKKKRNKEIQFVLQREMNSNLVMSVSDKEILSVLE